jgi:hypothetical protein
LYENGTRLTEAEERALAEALDCLAAKHKR